MPTPQAAISVTPSNITLTTDSGNSATVTVTNNGVVDAYNVSTTLATPNHGVMVNSTTCGSVLGYSPPNNTCTITFEMGAGGSAGTTNATIKGDNSNVSSVAISVVSPVAPVLSINSPAQPDRVIPVNNGSLDIVVVSSNPLATSNTDITASLPSAWVSSVTASYTDCTDVVPGGSCTIHLQATSPFVADEITINGTNGASPLTTYVAFRAGGGLVFSVNGGVTKVVTEANISSGIIWGGYGYEVGGINQNSTVSGGDPCDGKNDGGCNTTRIINCLTNQDNCVNTPSSSIDIATYAAGICDQYNGGTFNDWYLPAICEWSNSGNSCSIDNIYTNLRQHGFGGIVVGAYWSSTEVSTLPQDFAWYQLFAASGNSFQGGSTKSSQPGVRCVRGF
ncbi:protein with a bacterial immunoglobulin-like domain protein [Legionella shakespearei DSM 23087]|uniref:Protein with a bacterial immunoglobulin-like domain protein n=1 Tax=Legionella shakespearei DSM 23087 TaxID=1122169 RepID=A0A0W0YK34_9GAMM|nr:protein with a bacterial immunoglobulin-like domain protein [Legionella shakespearei DSM 23087]